jgi:hypothetical protein
MKVLLLKNSLKTLGLLAAASVAFASPITYTFTGIAGGTLGSASFSGELLTITLVGDTSNIVDNLTNGACAAADGCDQVFNDTSFTPDNPGAVQFSIAGIGSGTFVNGGDLLGCPSVCSSPAFVDLQFVGGTGDVNLKSSALATYVLATAIGPVTGSDSYATIQQSTSAGPLSIPSLTSFTFQATTGGQNPPPSTPEPGTFFLVSGALAAVFAVRRKP